MHADLVLIVRLWQLDSEIDEARGQAAALKTAVERVDQSIESMGQQLAGLAERKAAVMVEETDVGRELEKYIQRTARTRALMDGHQAVDFTTVEKQLEQCREHVSRLEDALLEILARLESTASEQADVEQALALARSERAALYAQWVERGREIRTELEAIWPRRLAAAGELNRDLANRYRGFRDKGIAPVAHASGKVCGACHVVIQDQMRLEVTSGRRIHTCRGCGRWLLPQLEPEVDPERPAE